MGEKYIVGDLHGNFKGLKQVFERANFDYQNDKVIFLGDICDGWSETKECMDFIMNIPNKEVLMGNHDEWALFYFTKKKHYANSDIDEEYLSWKSQGGYETIRSLVINGNIEQKYIDFLEDLKYYHIEDDNLFVHAGYVSNDILTLSENTPIENQHPYYLCWDRTFINYVYKCRMIENYKLNTPYKEIFVGHTPTISFNDSYKTPQNWLNVWAMDTGAAFSGKISMMNLETKEVFQSDESMKLYPNERGRNKRSYNEIKRMKMG